jgi:hypothetical protein
MHEVRTINKAHAEQISTRTFLKIFLFLEEPPKKVTIIYMI